MKKKAKKKSRKGRKTSPIPKSTTLPPEQLEKIIDFLKNTDKTFQQINKEMGFGVNDKTVSRINYEMNIRSQEEVRALAKNPKRVIPEKKRALIRGFLWSSRMTYAQIAKKMKVPPAWIYEVKKEDMPGLKRVYRKHDFIGAFSEKEKAKMVEENIGLLRVAVTDIIDVRYGPFFDQMLEEAKSGFLNALDYYNPKHPGKAKPAYFAIAGAKWAVLNYLGKESRERKKISRAGQAKKRSRKKSQRKKFSDIDIEDIDFSVLDERETTVIKGLIQGEIQASIAGRLKLSGERVSKIKKQALKKLRASIDKKGKK